MEGDFAGFSLGRQRGGVAGGVQHTQEASGLIFQNAIPWSYAAVPRPANHRARKNGAYLKLYEITAFDIRLINPQMQATRIRTAESSNL